MTSIIYVGMDVHTTNYTLCCYSMEDDRFFAEVQVEPDAKNILKDLARIEKQQSWDCRIVCGYEAGCLGYSLYHQLHAHGIDCVILAPTTMMTKPGQAHQDRSQRCPPDQQVPCFPYLQPCIYSDGSGRRSERVYPYAR